MKLDANERDELKRLRREVRRFRIEQQIRELAIPLIGHSCEQTYEFIDRHRDRWPLATLIRALHITKSAYYRWQRKRHQTPLEQTPLAQRARLLFLQSRCSLGSRQSGACRI